MTKPSNKPGSETFALNLRKWLLAAIALNFALAIFGLLVVPTAISASAEGLRSFGGILCILSVYFGVAFFLIKPTARFNSKILPVSFSFGLAAGFVFALEIILEYILLPSEGLNAKMGLVEFSGAFLLYFISGFWAAIKTKKYLPSIPAAVWSAILASLVWLIFVLLVYYLFHGGSRQTAVLTGEGDYEDFKQSGMTDFNAFAMQDFWGLAFFICCLGRL